MHFRLYYIEKWGERRGKIHNKGPQFGLEPRPLPSSHGHLLSHWAKLAPRLLLILFCYVLTFEPLRFQSHSPAVLSPWCWSPATTHLCTYSFHPELQQLRCTHLPVILLTSQLWIIGNKDHQSHSPCHSHTCSITLHGALRFLVFTKKTRLIHFLPTIFYLEYISLISSCLQAWNSCFSLCSTSCRWINFCFVNFCFVNLLCCGSLESAF